MSPASSTSPSLPLPQYLFQEAKFFFRGAGPMLLNCLWLFLLSWALRLILLRMGGYSFLGMDEQDYLRGARQIARGTFHENYFMPGWFYILSWVRGLSIEPRFFSTFIGALTVPFVYLTGEKTMGRKVGLVAGLLMAFYPEHLFFSHYLMAEVMLGLIISIATFVVFSDSKGVTTSQLFVASAILGVGLLYKHFVVIPFGAVLTLALFIKNGPKYFVVVCSLVFLAPVTLYSIGSSFQGRDPLLLLNSPLKSLKEWDRGRPLERIAKDDRERVFLNQTKKIMSKKFMPSFKRNLYNLWTPNSLPVQRLAYGRYQWANPPRTTMNVVAGYQIMIVILGLAGMCVANPHPLKIFTLSSLAYLTSMATVWFMVARYRLPFMPLLILYAASALVHPRRLTLYFQKIHAGRGVAFALLMILFFFICLDRYPQLGSWN